MAFILICKAVKEKECSSRLCFLLASTLYPVVEVVGFLVWCDS
jgi:hypothetical protein